MNFRNVGLKSYIKSLEYLVGLGFYIIRMGKNTKEPISFKSDKKGNYEDNFVYKQQYTLSCNRSFLSL